MGYDAWLTHLEKVVTQIQSSLFNTSTLTSLDTQLCKRAFGTQPEKWTSWAKPFPDHWRRAFASHPSPNWVKAHSLLQKLQTGATTTFQATEQDSPSNIRDVPKSVDIRSWIGAVKMLMPQPYSRRNLIQFTDRDSFRQAMDNINYGTEDFLGALPPCEEEPFVGEFRRTLQESHHTCYELEGWSWHASALWLATGYDQRKWMPMMRSKSCAICRVTPYLEDFVTVGKHLSVALKPQERLDALLQEIVSQSKALLQ
jgi:hypothetical protein